MRRLYFISTGNKLNFYNVRYVIKKKETGSTINKPRTVHPRKLDTRQRWSIIREPSKNPFLCDRELTVDVASRSGTIATQTIKNILHGANVRERAPRKKHLLGKQIDWKDLNLQ